MTANSENNALHLKLLRQVIAGDETAFVTLYRDFSPGIYRFALRMSGNESLAEDVTQEVFMIMMQEGHRYDEAKGSLKSYLYGVTRFQIWKKVARDRSMISIDNDNDFSEDLFSVLPDPLLDLSRAETVHQVREAILVLPPHYREAVVLCDLHELSYLEAAEILGCAIGTVRSRLHRARGLLAERLRPVQQVARHCSQ